jgi:hypothetical protein
MKYELFANGKFHWWDLRDVENHRSIGAVAISQLATQDPKKSAMASMCRNHRHEIETVARRHQ